MYKKKSLKFTYEKVSRNFRHVESLKARETSRFKRLSMIRSINDSILNEKSMESIGEKECKDPENRKPPSRLEMLFKWKKEKEMKKEMEKLSKKKPFAVGGNTKAVDNKNLQSLKTSFIGKANSTFNSSKLVKNKLETPSATPSVLSSRIQTSKQGSSKVPSSRVPNSRQGAPTSTFQSSRIPNSKQTNSVQKSASSLTRSNSTAATYRKLPVSATTIDKTNSLQKSENSLTRSNSTAAPPRKFQVPTSTVDKIAPVSKVVSGIQRIPSVKKTPNNVCNSNSKNLPKPVNKGSFESKSLTKHQGEKSVTKTGSSLPKLTSNTTAVSKGLPILSKMPVSSMNKNFGSNPKLNKKMPVSSMNKNFGSNPKLNKKEMPQPKENISSRKGYCFRTAVTNSSRQQIEKVPKTPIQGTPKKVQEKVVKEDKPPKKELLEQSLDCIPDVTFNSDISIIKPSRTSFAPANFTFRPPECLGQFVFDDDDDDDVYETLEEMKQKFMSRTSTPSKSLGKNSKESLDNNDLMADVKEMPDKSNSSKDIRISELMTPESFKIKGEDEEADKVVKIQAADIAVNHVENVCQESVPISPLKTVVKEADVAENQQQFKDSIFLSLIKNDVKESKHTTNLQNFEAIASDINRNLNETESAEKDVDNDLVKKLFSEKQSFDDFDKSENIEENAVDVSQEVLGKKSLFNNSVKNRTSSDSKVLKIKSEDEEADKVVKIQACNEDANIALKRVENVCQELVPISPLKIEVKDADVVKNQQQFKESASRSPNKNDFKESNHTTNLQNFDQMVSDINRDLNETESAEKNVDSDLVKKLFSEKQSFDDFDKNKNVEENAINVSQEVLGKKSLFNNSVKKRTSLDAPVKSLFPDYGDDDSLLDSIDLNKLQLIKSDDEDTDDDDVPSPQILKRLEGKTTGAISKRVSMLKSLSVMNSIFETTETDESSVSPVKSSTKNIGITNMPRRSKRISSHYSVDMLNDFHTKNHVGSPNISVTPRRSLRLMKIPAASDNVVASPLAEKKTNVNLRRSMRLIDLSTPEKAVCEKLYGENMDPNAFLIDFESPTLPSFKSKKVSLLYSPEKRKSIRKSIKGDLMAFSPS